MRPIVHEYTNDELLVNDVQELAQRGVSKEDMYILSHDHDRTNRVADQTDANKIGVSELGLGDALNNFFSSEGDELRTKIEKMGLSPAEARIYEEKLDEGKILLFITDPQKAQSWI